jgi:hypothetical protein
VDSVALSSTVGVSSPAADTTLTSDTTFTSDHDVESTPSSPIDWLNPPDGQIALALSSQYADVDWFDVDRGMVLDSYNDAANCTKVYDAGANDFGFVECDRAGEDWFCQCYSAPDDYDWIVLPSHFVDTSANTGEACRLAVAISLTELPPAEAQCYDSGVWGGFSAQQCVRDDRCEYNHASAHGDIVESVLMPFVECSAYEDDYPLGQPSYYCNGTNITGFDLAGRLDAELGRTTQNACDVGYQVFFHGVDPGSEGEQSCEPLGSPTVEVIDGQELYCDARYRCSTPATAFNEPVALVYPLRDVSCYRSLGEWKCRCDARTFSWANVDGVTACNSALTECMSPPMP